MFSFENIYRCYLKCRKNKRHTINALRFEINAEENIFALSEELFMRVYKPSRSVCFVVEKPKMREIIAADFKDRIIHHVLIERLERIYEPIFIYDSYACRKQKGIHKALERVKTFTRKGSANGNKKLFFLHLDIKNFFMTIDKDVLYKILSKKVKEKDILWLSKVIIFNNPVNNYIVKGNKALFKVLPPHKSLFNAQPNRGIPVGNLTSQFFANVYLNELDQYVKHTLKCTYYLRYCDDFLILEQSKERLEQVRDNIERFVNEKLHLVLNEKYHNVLPVSNGIDFLGYIIRGNYTLVRRRVVNNMKTRLDIFKKQLVSEVIIEPPLCRFTHTFLNPHTFRHAEADLLRCEQNSNQVIRYEFAIIKALRSTVSSYFGHIGWANNYRLKSMILKKYTFLNDYFIFKNGKITFVCNLKDDFYSVRVQYIYYASMFKDSVIFFQVGKFYEFYDELTNEVKVALNLKKIKVSRRGAMYGFPATMLTEKVSKILDKCIDVVIIKETGKYIFKLKERVPIMKIKGIKIIFDKSSQ